MNQEKEDVSRWTELRKHPAFQAAAVWIGASWALIEGADILFPSAGIARWLAAILGVGFVLAVGGTWLSARQAARSTDAAAEVSEPTRRRRRRYAYAAAAALLALGGLFWWIRPHILGAVEPDAQVIAVLPFHASGPNVELLGAGMVDLLSPTLDGVGGIRSVDSRTVLYHWDRRADGGSLDLDGSLAVGRDVDAGSILLGSVVEAGPVVRLTAQLYSVGGTELAEASAEGPADSVLGMVDSLGVRVLKEIWLAREPVPNLRVSGMTTGNVNAIRAYLEGQQAYRRNDWGAAAEALQEAVAEDSTFALAHYRLALTLGWAGFHGGPLVREYAEAAARHADRLPAREHTLVTAHMLFEKGRIAAHDTMLSYVRQHPDDPEGWYLLGDIRYHAQPLAAFSLDDLLSPFDRVIELDPSLAPALVHPLELSLAHDDSARYSGYLTALEAIASDSYVELFRVARLVWTDPANVGEQLFRLGQSNLNDEVGLNFYRSDVLRPEMMLPFFEQLAAFADLPDAALAQVLSAQASVLASLGRLEEARPVFERLWEMAGPDQQVAYSWVVPVWANIADSAYVAPVLEAQATPGDDPATEQGRAFGRMIWALSRGRAAEARRFADAALAADVPEAMNPFPALARAGLGWADVLDGDTIAGIERLRAGLEEAGYTPSYLSGMNMSLRFALASAEASHPRTRLDGIRRLRYGSDMTDIVYLPISYLLLAEALEKEGDRVGAAEAYSHFIRLWENADPGLQPRVETARRALERLAAEPAN